MGKRDGQKRILVGYSMRSGSTLLQHILGQHTDITSFSDASSFVALGKVLARAPFSSHICVKPMDLLFFQKRIPLRHVFNKFVWMARDPRDSYLSSIESGYAYVFWPKGKEVYDIDVGLLERWKKLHAHYFRNQDRWHLARYEDLVDRPESTLNELLSFLDIPHQKLLPFKTYDFANGGDYKIVKTTNIDNRSVRRYRKQMTKEQSDLFKELLGPEMKQLGYI